MRKSEENKGRGIGADRGLTEEATLEQLLSTYGQERLYTAVMKLRRKERGQGKLNSGRWNRQLAEVGAQRGKSG